MQPKLYKDYEFPCPLGPVIKAYIAEKRSLGGKANTESRRLREFAKTDYAQDLHNELTKEAVCRWIEKRPFDKPASMRQRYAIIRGLGLYMLRQGMPAFVPTQANIRKLPRHGYMPHIFTYAEIIRFMDAAKTYGTSKHCTSREARYVFPLIFEMLYCTGMRVGEVVTLEVADIDFTAGIILVKNAKFGKRRYIPIRESLCDKLKQYVQSRKPQHYLFPSKDGGCYSEHSVYDPFREILFKAGIPHKGKGFGPRVHDFRHTFTVHSMVRWLEAGYSLSNALPRISTYLGHNSLADTEWYIHLTMKTLPSLWKEINEKFSTIYPKEFQNDK